MIRNPRQIQLMRLGLPVVPANFGGDSDSDSSTRTSTSTSNWTNYNDKRAVASDQATAVTGDGNSIDRSTTSSFYDTSNRSTTNLTSFLDQSNRSTNFADYSDRSVTNVTNTTVTDYGSVSGGLGLADKMGTKAIDLGGLAVSGAIDTLKLQTKTGADQVAAAFDLAKSAAANSMANSAQVLGFATSAIQKVDDAFAESKDGGQKKMVMYALAAVAAIGVAFALKR